MIQKKQSKNLTTVVKISLLLLSIGSMIMSMGGNEYDIGLVQISHMDIKVTRAPSNSLSLLK